jgi:hypothetical protein
MHQSFQKLRGDSPSAKPESSLGQSHRYADSPRRLADQPWQPDSHHLEGCGSRRIVRRPESWAASLATEH